MAATSTYDISLTYSEATNVEIPCKVNMGLTIEVQVLTGSVDIYLVDDPATWSAFLDTPEKEDIINYWTQDYIYDLDYNSSIFLIIYNDSILSTASVKIKISTTDRINPIWILIGVIGALLVVGGIVIGIFLSKRKKNTDITPNVQNNQ